MSTRKTVPREWPAAKAETRDPAKLLLREKNPRVHIAGQIAKIARSIEEWGWTTPILVDEDDRVVAGHGRLAAALKLELERVPVVVARGWTEEQRRAYVIADNQLALDAGWDLEMLGGEIGALKKLDFDIELLGFGAKEMKELLSLNADEETHPLPEPQKTPVSKLGDLWVLGEHRLLCGDSTSEADMCVLLDGAKPEILVTDSPYGVNYDPAWRQRAAEEGKIAYGASRIGKVFNDDRADWRETWKLVPCSVAYVWHGSLRSGLVQETLEDAGFGIKSQIVWSKPHFPISRRHYHWRHEPCWYAVRGGKRANWIGDRKQTTVWEIALDQNVEGGHSTQKPVELFARPLRNHEGDLLDPFVGSGTALIAAENRNRRCFAMELSPAYVDVAVVRWQNHAESEAHLDAKGMPTFTAVTEERFGMKGTRRDHEESKSAS